MVYLNTQHPLLASTSIRQALSLSVDRTAITDHILLGALPLKKPLPSALLSSPISAHFEEDLSKAKALFEKGLEELEFTRESCPPIEISYSQQANRKQVAEYLQQTWSKTFGIEVGLRSEEWNILRTNLEKGLFTISGTYEAAYYNDPLEIMERLASSGPCNFAQWVNLAYGEKIGEAKQESEFEKRQLLLSEAEQILIEEFPFIPISADILTFAHHPDLKGYVFDYVGAIDFSYASLP